MRNKLGKVLKTDWLIGNGSVGMMVTAGLVVVVPLPLITIMLVTCIQSNGRSGINGDAGLHHVVVTILLHQMGAVKQDLTGKGEEKEKERTEISFMEQ